VKYSVLKQDKLNTSKKLKCYRDWTTKSQLDRLWPTISKCRLTISLLYRSFLNQQQNLSSWMF